MTQRLSSGEIDDLAAAWAAKVEIGPLSPEEDAALDAWLELDSRHLGAFAKARAVALHSLRAQALGADFDPDSFVEARTDFPAPTRRRFLAMGSAAAAALTAMSALSLHFLRERSFSTQIGETRIVSLEDGSIITLDTNSEVVASYSKARRDIRLARGQALFDVAKDAKRPFTVDAGKTLVRAVGTSFTVSLLPNRPVEVLVREGVVEITHPENPAPVRAAANIRAVVARGAEVATTAVDSAAVSRATAWRVGRISFEGDTLSQAAAEFARYSDIRIVIDDRDIGAQTITGLFVANDPIGFSKSVAVSLNLRADVGEHVVRLLRQ